jgi:starch synthase
MRRLPCVLSVDSTVGQFTELAYQGPPDRWTPAQLRANRALERRAFSGAAVVLAWTDHIAAAIREEYGLPEDRLATFHPGIDVSWWAKAASERARIHAEDDERLRVLFVGNDVGRKGLGTLIAAVGRLGDAVSLDVVSGDEIEASAGVRVHHGLRPGTVELRDRFAAADVFVLPTTADAVPWGVLEAMAAGLPVISSTVGSIPELVGETGDLIEPGDDVALAEAIERYLDSPLREARGAAAMARARERYDSRTQIPRLVAVLHDAARRGGRAGGV